jgi:hypothetical protein
MARDAIRTLKMGVRQGSAKAAVVLLERSISLGHKKLAVLRYVVAERLGAVPESDQLLYCQSIVRKLSDEEMASILRQAAELVPRAIDGHVAERTLARKAGDCRVPTKV